MLLAGDTDLLDNEKVHSFTSDFDVEGIQTISKGGTEQ